MRKIFIALVLTCLTLCIISTVAMASEYSVLPKVISTSPANGATNVSTDSEIVVNYSGSLNVPGTGGGYEIRDGSGKIVNIESIRGGDKTQVFHIKMLPGTKYIVKVYTANNSSREEYEFSFTTADGGGILEVPNIKIVINGERKTFVDVPIALNGRTLLP